MTRIEAAMGKVLRRVVLSENGCWLCLSGLDKEGYSCVYTYADGKSASHKSHRVAYEYFVGEIGEGMHVDHTCSVRCCVNPEHLERVTPQENTRRAWLARKWKWIAPVTGERVCKRGHPMSGDNIARNNQGELCRKCKNERSRADKRRARMGEDK